MKCSENSYIKAGQSNNDVNLQGKEEMYVASKGVIENIPLRLGIGDSSWRDNPSTQEFD